MIFDPHNVIRPYPGDEEMAAAQATGHDSVIQTPELLVSAMDRNGIDLCCAYSRDNDFTASAVQKFPERILGTAWVNPSLEGAVEELHRALFNLKLKGGLKLSMPTAKTALTSNRVMDRIFDLLIQADMPLLGHSAEGDHMFSMPYQFEHIARRFPQLNIIMAHAGVPDDYMEAIKVATWCDNVYLGSHAVPGAIVKLAVQRAGAHKVLLATDTPAEVFEVEMKKIELAVPDISDREMVMGGNAQRLFHI